MRLDAQDIIGPRYQGDEGYDMTEPYRGTRRWAAACIVLGLVIGGALWLAASAIAVVLYRAIA